MYLETKTRYIMKIISEQTQSKFLTFFFLYFSGFFFFGEQNLIISVQIWCRSIPNNRKKNIMKNEWVINGAE
jgi:hypothetical protein